MDFITKNGLYIKLQNTKTPEADEALLKEKNPGAKPLQTKYFDDKRKKKEILWELLEHATEKEIQENRAKFGKKENPEDEKKKAKLAEINEIIKTDVLPETVKKLEDKYMEEFEADLYQDLYEYGFIEEIPEENQGDDDSDTLKSDPLTYEYLDENFTKQEMIDKFGLDLSKDKPKQVIIETVLNKLALEELEEADSKKKESESNPGNG